MDDHDDEDQNVIDFIWEQVLGSDPNAPAERYVEQPKKTEVIRTVYRRKGIIAFLLRLVGINLTDPEPNRNDTRPKH